jgi:type I restriction enzyme M protein
MNAFIHDMDAEIALGDTMRSPRFTGDDGRLRRFDIVTANPMWNQDFAQSTYENDPYHRFEWGAPPSSTADWGWVQHMFRSLSERGRMAVVLDAGAVSRGSGALGTNRERDIRRRFVEHDLVEAVLQLPENLFFNTSAPGIVMVINRAKRHPGEILLINAMKQFEKGRPKNRLGDQHVELLARTHEEWNAAEGLSAIVATSEAVQNDCNLAPSRYVAADGGEDVMPLEDAVVLLAESEEERAAADRELERILSLLGLANSAHD